MPSEHRRRFTNSPYVMPSSCCLVSRKPETMKKKGTAMLASPPDRNLPTYHAIGLFSTVNCWSYACNKTTKTAQIRETARTFSLKVLLMEIDMCNGKNYIH